jgi:hypothetical protein
MSTPLVTPLPYPTQLPAQSGTDPTSSGRSPETVAKAAVTAERLEEVATSKAYKDTLNRINATLSDHLPVRWGNLITWNMHFHVNDAIKGFLQKSHGYGVLLRSTLTQAFAFPFIKYQLEEKARSIGKYAQNNNVETLYLQEIPGNYQGIDYQPCVVDEIRKFGYFPVDISKSTTVFSVKDKLPQKYKEHKDTDDSSALMGLLTISEDPVGSDVNLGKETLKKCSASMIFNRTEGSSLISYGACGGSDKTVLLTQDKNGIYNINVWGPYQYGHDRYNAMAIIAEMIEKLGQSEKPFKLIIGGDFNKDVNATTIVLEKRLAESGLNFNCITAGPTYVDEQGSHLLDGFIEVSKGLSFDSSETLIPTFEFDQAAVLRNQLSLLPSIIEKADQKFSEVIAEAGRMGLTEAQLNEHTIAIPPEELNTLVSGITGEALSTILVKNKLQEVKDFSVSPVNEMDTLEESFNIKDKILEYLEKLTELKDKNNIELAQLAEKLTSKFRAVRVYSDDLEGIVPGLQGDQVRKILITLKILNPRQAKLDVTKISDLDKRLDECNELKGTDLSKLKNKLHKLLLGSNLNKARVHPSSLRELQGLLKKESDKPAPLSCLAECFPSLKSLLPTR